jgi:CubicO group peptidase (beta-lactamase class C family)
MPGTETDMSIPQGAGAIVSTAADINRFLIALFSGKLISESSLEQMKTIDQGYGLGIFQMPFGEKISFGHSGGIDAFQSMAGYFPEEKLAVTYLSNGVVYPVNSVMIGVLNIIFGQPFELPEFHKISKETLDRYVGTYTSPALPIDLKIFRDGVKLMGQGTGQPAFPLTSVNETTFTYQQAGLSVEFKPEENKLILSQGGGTFEMTRSE